MSIEVSPPSTEPKKTGAAAGSHAAKGKGKDSAGGGFNAILGAIDDGNASATAAASAISAAAAAAAAQAADAAKGSGKDALPAGALDAAAMLAQNPQIPALLPVAAGVPLQAPVGKTDAEQGAGPAGVLAGGKGKSPAGLPSGKPADLPSDAGDGSAKPLAGAAGHARTAQMAAADASANASSTAAASAASATAANAASAADAKDAKMAQAMEFMKAVQAAPAVEQTLSGTGINKPEKSTGERISKAATTGADATYSATTLGVSNSPGDNASNAGGVAPTPEVQVAEQVKYWMSSDVKNAELKLDGLGKDPVQVSISMTGNEAHIAFRTDETQTRGILEGAAAHLKDMLGREGVVLAGVSVGTSGSQSDPGSERRPRQGVRQAFVAAPVASVAVSGHRAPVGSGRSLDLFV